MLSTVPFAPQVGSDRGGGVGEHASVEGDTLEDRINQPGEPARPPSPAPARRGRGRSRVSPPSASQIPPRRAHGVVGSRVGSGRTAACRLRLHDHGREDRRDRHMSSSRLRSSMMSGKPAQRPRDVPPPPGADRLKAAPGFPDPQSIRVRRRRARNSLGGSENVPYSAAYFAAFPLHQWCLLR